jgi:hypothetical protein
VKVRPSSIKAANKVVAKWHRHHDPVHGALWAVACEDDGGEVCGVAIVGRPIARLLDDGTRCEVVRVAVRDGARNACSMLYGACRRAAKALGYREIITYTLEREPGTSLLASGWRDDGIVKADDGDRPTRKRKLREGEIAGPKRRWVAALRDQSMTSFIAAAGSFAR